MIESETLYPSDKKSFWKMVRWTVVAAVFVFLGRMVWNSWDQVKDAPFAVRLLPFVLSILIFAFSYLFQIWAWYHITVKLRIAVSFQETLENWFFSQWGKYLPGKVWMFLGRFHLYAAKGKSKREISVALFFETVTGLVAAGLISFAALVVSGGEPFHSGIPLGWVILSLAVALIFLHPWILQKILNWFLVRLNKEAISLSVSYPDMVWVLCLCILGWLIGGFGFYLFIHSVFPVSSQHIPFLTGALAFSTTLGLIALFAPSGLGVREGILVYLLSYLMPGGVAVILSVLTRIWGTLIEIGLTGVVYLWGQLRRGLKKRGRYAGRSEDQEKGKE